MAKFDRLKVLTTMIEQGVIPVFYNKDLETSKNIIKACAAGGLKLVEFTNRGDFAYYTFSSLSQYFADSNPEIILGAGSIVDAPTAAMYIGAGANFIVGPNLNPEIARLCNRRKIAYSPGCGSATEIAEAEELGVEIVKVFPGDSVGGPAFVKSMLGPCPWTRIMPTGGVDSTEESINAWFKAGVACVGMGSNLITKDLVSKGDWNGITEKAKLVRGYIQSARKS
jgi:2-dehydro-3-deoxyphosphogluconate aldolase/(4S)-4-hydroxy-2-oxoglutarate aldolase